MRRPDPPDSPAPAETGPILVDAYCESCGYNLRGLTVGRCPECGNTFDTDALPAPRAAWGPAVWESTHDIAYLRRLALTWYGFLVHPIGSFRQLGDDPRPVGWRHVSLLGWMLLLSGALALATYRANTVIRDWIRQWGYMPLARSDFQRWLNEQISWWDSMLISAFDAATILVTAAVVHLLNRKRDLNVEIGLYMAMIGLLVVAWQLGPSPLALLPALVALSTVVLTFAVYWDGESWAHIVVKAARVIVYFTAIGMFFDLYLWTIDTVAGLVCYRYFDPLKTHTTMAHARVYMSAIVFSGLLMFMLRFAFDVRPWRAAALATLYLGLRLSCLNEFALADSPLALIATRLGWLTLR